MQETWVRSLGWEDPIPVFWPGEFHGLYSPWGHKESDTTETFTFTYLYLAALGLCCCMLDFSIGAGGDYSLSAMRGLLTAVASRH